MISQNSSGPLTDFWVAGLTRVFFYSTRCERDYRRSNILKTLQVLTVRSGEANSHKARGWEQLTDSVDFEKSKCTFDISIINVINVSILVALNMEPLFKVIKWISDNCNGVVFMLWGGYAQKKAAKVTTKLSI